MSGRARQVNHRLRNRKNAIISRREAEAAASDDYPARSPTSSAHRGAQSNGERMSVSPTSGFVAVNQQASNQDARNESTYADTPLLPDLLPPGRPANGTLMHSASAATRAELLSKFFTNSQRAAALDQEQGKGSSLSTRPASSGKVKIKHASDEHAAAVSGSPVPIPHTPSSLLPYSKSTPQDRFDDSGPYKSDMMARMEQLNRGDRVQPPCDRCRRLHMDCSKNLTACIGCTRKHAKCSWKDVTEQELIDNPPVLRSAREGAIDAGGEVEQRSRDPYRDLPTISHNNVPRNDLPKEESRGVRDEELLGEEASGDEDASHHEQHYSTTPKPPTAFMSTEQKETIRSMNERSADEVSRAIPSPNTELDDQASTIFTAGSEYEGRPPTSTDGFQSVSVKGVVVGYDPATEQDDIEMKTEQDKERDALIQLSAAAQQVSEYQQQQREFSKEEAEEQNAPAQ